MFKSKLRAIAVPQWEHARLSGILASLWGNEEFDRPAFDFDSFVLGVTVHDRGYGLLDNRPIGEVPSELWLATQREGILDSADDPVADVVALLHIRRLLTRSDAAGREDLVALADHHIQQSLGRAVIPLEPLAWADRITRWCDNVAFDFSFEKKLHAASTVCPRRESLDEIPVHHDLRGGGRIVVDPWPFAVDSYAGFVVGYHLQGYPDRLQPVLLPFSLIKAGTG